LFVLEKKLVKKVFFYGTNSYIFFLSKQGDIFEREVDVYMEIMPALMKLNDGILIPKASYGNPEEGILFMENLKLQGFATKNKNDGNHKHCFFLI
jgi:hypothetical protein